MPKKSDVPSKITRAAIALFSRQGYHGTSTRDIARLADVSEVTLYRYFERKEDVFWAALTSSFDSLKPRLAALEPGSRNATTEMFLRRILNLLFDTATFNPELVRLIAVALLEVRGRAQDVCREHMTPIFKTITSYLQVNIDEGRVRNLNPSIMAMGIALTIFAQPELAKVIQGCALSNMDSREAMDAYTEFWLGTLLPSEQERAGGFSAPEALTV
jgi:AcrR family transcriptional regulator